MYEGRYAYCSVIVDKKISSTICISKSVFPKKYLFLSVFFQNAFIQSVFLRNIPPCVNFVGPLIFLKRIYPVPCFIVCINENYGEVDVNFQWEAGAGGSYKYAIEWWLPATLQATLLNWRSLNAVLINTNTNTENTEKGVAA